MISKILETLWADDYKGVSKNVEIAKGRYNYISSFRQAWTFIIRRIALWRKSE